MLPGTTMHLETYQSYFSVLVKAVIFPLSFRQTNDNMNSEVVWIPFAWWSFCTLLTKQKYLHLTRKKKKRKTKKKKKKHQEKRKGKEKGQCNMKSLKKVKIFWREKSVKYKCMQITLQNTIKALAIIILYVYFNYLYVFWHIEIFPHIVFT